MSVGRRVDERELLDLFEPDEGSINFYYGRIGHGKTYAATADILDLLGRGEVVYCNWHIDYDGFDQRESRQHAFWHFIFGRKRFFKFRKENLRYFSPDDVDIAFLASLTDCHVFIDEGQWIFDSYEGRTFSQEKRRLILHTRHLNRSLSIVSQRTQAVQVSARGQVNRFFKCEKKMEWPWLVFRRTEFQDMAGDDVDENSEPISVKVYFAKREVLNAYDTHYLRAGVPKSQKVEFEAYDLTFRERFLLLLGRLKVDRDIEARASGSPEAARLSLINALKAVSEIKKTQFYWSRHILDLSPETRAQRRKRKRTLKEWMMRT